MFFFAQYNIVLYIQMTCIKKFDVDSIQDNSSIVMIAKRNSGKSFLVRDLVYKLDIPVLLVIAPTEKLNGYYKSFVPEQFIHYEYKTEILSRLFKRQENLINKNREREREGKKALDSRVLLIMDDCLASRAAWAKDKNILELLQNGRHYNITYVLTLQFSLGIQPELRSNFDFIFLLSDDFGTNQKRLYDHYAGMFSSFDTFKEVFVNVTDNYGCMVINSQKKSKNINEKVFWYRAEATPDGFRAGSHQYKLFKKSRLKSQAQNKESEDFIFHIAL